MSNIENINGILEQAAEAEAIFKRLKEKMSEVFDESEDVNTFALAIAALKFADYSFSFYEDSGTGQLPGDFLDFVNQIYALVRERK